MLLFESFRTHKGCNE